MPLVFALALLLGMLPPRSALAAVRTLWTPTPGTSTYAIGAYSITGLTGCTPVTPTNGNITIEPVNGGTVTLSAQSFMPPNCPGVSFPGTAAYFEYTVSPGLPGSGWDAFQVHFASAAGMTTWDVVVFEGMPGSNLGRQPPRPCTGCEAGAGMTSVPPVAGDDLPVTASMDVSTDGRAAAAAPIDIGSGNVFYEHTDYTTAGRNPLAFRRYYNSGASMRSFAVSLAGTSGASHNWRSNFDPTIDVLTPNAVIIERPDGRAFPFYLVGTTWTPDSDVDYALTHSGTAWTLTGPDDTVETYAAAVASVVSGGSARLTTVKSRNGYTQTLTYTGGVLTSVTDSYGRTLTFTRDASGAIASVVTPDNTTITYAYNTVAIGSTTLQGQQLLSVTYPTSPAQTISYSYGDSRFPFALTGVTDENGNPYDAWTYDAAGRGLTSSQGGALKADLYTFTYPAVGVTATVTNALGVTDTYSFAQLHSFGGPQVTQISRAATATTAAATRAFTYDANGYLASETDWNGNKTTYTNNAHGLPTTLVEGAGSTVARTVAIAYNTTFPRLPATVTTAGVTRAIAYDAAGEPLTIKLTDTTTTTAPYATKAQARTWTNSWANSLLASVTTPNGNTTKYAYDGTGALTSVTDALTHATNITSHTGGGLPLTVIDPNGVTTVLTYDERQRLLSSSVSTGGGARTTRYAYDSAGNLTQTTLPDGSFLANRYDNAHRLTHVTDALGNAIAYTLDALGDRTSVNVYDGGGTLQRQHSATFDALGRVLVDTGGAGQTTTVAHDANGNALSVTDGLSHKTTRTFDALNRLATSTDANAGVTTVTYDAHDRITAVKDANGNTTSYVFDGFGEAIGQTSPDSGATTYHFDLDGNLTQKLDAAGVTVTMTYDPLERLLIRSFPADGTQNATYAYDTGTNAASFLVGRLATRADATGTTAFAYDERGNLLAAKSSGTPGGANLTTSYAYDAASRLAQVTYPSGLTIGYSRDAQGNVNAVSATLPGAVAATPMASLQTLPFGPDFASTLGNGVTESRTYDRDYRLTHVTAAGSNGSLEDLSYALDTANNVTAITDAVQASNSQTLGYDSVNRLTSATSGASGYGSLGWVHDKVGNLTSRTAKSVATTYGYATGSNRLAGITTGGVTTPVAINANGSITSIPPANATSPATFAYNVAGRLASVTGSATAASFVYDDWGRRVSKTDTGGGTTTYAYGQFGALLEEATGGAVTDYIYVNGRLLGTFAPSAAASAMAAPVSGGRKVASTSLLRTHPEPGGNGLMLILAAGLLLLASTRLRSGRRRVAFELTPLALALGLVFVACGSADDSGGGSGGNGTGGTPNGGSGGESGQPSGATDAGGNATAGMPNGGNAGASGEPPATMAGGEAGATGMIPTGSTTLYYVHTDHLGTPQLATDASQNVVWSASYEPYGVTDTATGSITQNFRLPGQYSDAETGFYQNGFRDYVPNLGRYLESDPIGLAGGTNPYLYADANPLGRIDPLGLTPDLWNAFWNGYAGIPGFWPTLQNNVITLGAIYTGGELGAARAFQRLFADKSSTTEQCSQTDSTQMAQEGPLPTPMPTPKPEGEGDDSYWQDRLRDKPAEEKKERGL